MFSRNGKVKDRSLMSVGNLVLISLRDFQDDKADILMFYSKAQVDLLVQYDEIDKNFIKQVNGDSNNNNMVDDIFNEMNEMDEIDEKNSDMKLEDIWDDI
jgi:translation initiation factor 1A